MTLPADGCETEREVKPFLDHLADLRKALIRSSVALVVGVLIAAPAAPWVWKMLAAPLIMAGKDPNTFLGAFQVTAGVGIAMRIALWSGVLIASPFIVFFAGGFIFPGLRAKERRLITRLSLVMVALFAAGVGLAYSILTPALQVMIRVNNWMGVPTGPWMIGDYVTFCLGLLLAFGLVFELPVLIVLLGHFGILSSKQLREKRPHVIVMLLIVAAILTPTPDPFTQLLMAVPLIALYEAAILIVRVLERRTTSR